MYLANFPQTAKIKEKPKQRGLWASSSRLGEWVAEGNLLPGGTVETTTQLVSRWNQQVSGIGSQKMAASPTLTTPAHPTHPSSHLSQHLSFKRKVQRKIKCMVRLCAQSLSRVRLCDPMDSPPGSSVHGLLQARILKWVATSYSRGSSQPRDQMWILFFFWQVVLFH